MNIAFYAHDFLSGGSTLRCRYPAMWINTYTEHHAWIYTEAEAAESGHLQSIRNMDVVVFEKNHQVFAELAAKIRKLYKHILVIFDTDDFEAELFGEYWITHYMANVETDPRRQYPDADGIICASHPLMREYQSILPCTVIENGFDVSLPYFQPRSDQYFNDQIKVVWGGGTSHIQDVEMLLKLGALQELCSMYYVDFYFFGMAGFNLKRPCGKGSIYMKVGVSQPDYYMKRLYADASIHIAPLVQNKFNNYRSTLKLVEAGVMGHTIVASNVETYDLYEGREHVVLVDNNADDWFTALETLILDAPKRERMGADNRKAVEEYHSAEHLTRQRISFFENLITSLGK